MKLPIPHDPYTDAMLAADDADFPAEEWMLDDVEVAADLASIASAQARLYDPDE